MLQAKIFKADETTIGGQAITTDHLSRSIAMFNGNTVATMVMFDTYPGTQDPTELDRICGTATLEMVDDMVIASVVLTDTPMGKIAQSLQDGIGLHVMPITSVGMDGTSQLQLRIRCLVIPTNTQHLHTMSSLKKVQRWVSGPEQAQWDMFELKEHK